MSFSVIGHCVRRHHNCCIGLVDGIGDRCSGDVVVVGGPREAPVIAGVRSGVRMGRIERDRTDSGSCFTVHAGD